MYLIRKLIQKSLAPESIVLIFLCIIAICARRRPRAAQILAFAALAILLPLSTPFFADQIIQHLEEFAPPVALQNVPKAGAIVVLGGTVPPNPEQTAPAEETSGSRVATASALYKLGKADFVVASGGITYKTSTNELTSNALIRTEAQDIYSILADYGVPEDKIILEDKSQNTLENALYTAIILKQLGIKEIILVSSSFHMKRATTLFRQTGLSVVPVSSGRWIRGSETSLLKFFPSAHSLSRTTSALKEYAGILLERPMENHPAWAALKK